MQHSGPQAGEQQVGEVQAGGEEGGLTVEVVKDLMELLVNPSVQVRHGTLSAILQYTPTAQSRLLFGSTQLLTCLRKYVFIPKLTTISLSTLIHFAGDSQFTAGYFSLIEPLVLQMKQWKQLQLQLSLLLLLNLSKQQAVVVRLLGEEEKKGYLVEVLYALLQREVKLRWILVGVFVNVSAVERGRRFLVEEGVFVRFIGFLNGFQEKLREASLKIMRNCAFEWQYQPFATEALSPANQLINRILKLIGFLIVRRELLHDLTHLKLLLRGLFGEGEVQNWEKGFVCSDKARAIAEIELGIDIVLILSNVNFTEKKVEMNREAFKEMLSLLKFVDIKEETKDKLEALEIFGL